MSPQDITEERERLQRVNKQLENIADMCRVCESVPDYITNAMEHNNCTMAEAFLLLDVELADAFETIQLISTEQLKTL